MKKLITWSLVLILYVSLMPTFLPIVNASPTTWYVATTGSDTAAGDIDHPLLTLNKAINKSSNGDIIYLRGGNYNTLLGSSKTLGIYINRSGTRTQPFTIATYPADLAAGNRAIINGNGYTLSSYHGLLNINYKSGTGWENNITINSITIENSSRDGIYIAGDSSGRSNDIIINDCKFNNIATRAVSVLQYNVATKGCLENITISNCTFWKIQASLSMGEAVAFAGVKNFVFENNTNLWSRTIFLDIGSQSNHGKISNNIFHLNESGSTPGVAHSIYLNGMDHNNQTVSDIDIYNNLFCGTLLGDNDVIALAGETATGHLYRINIYNNIINVSGASSSYDINGIKFCDDSEDHTAYVYYNNITIKYNTIYCKRPLYLQCVVAATHDLVIANNILIGQGTGNYQLQCVYLASTSTELTRKNNLYYHPNKAANNYFSDGTGKWETGSIRDDPDFVFLSTDFHLNQTSPAIDAASSTYTIPLDYDGITRPVFEGYDIGAYEYNGGEPGDSTPPVISQVGVVTSSPIDTLMGYGWENFTCVVTDNVGVSTVILKLTNPDQSTMNIPMIKKISTTTYYTNQSLHQQGNYSYRIQATDTSNNVAFSSSYTFSLSPNWDINNDGVVKILDLVLVSNHYGETGDNGWIREDVDNNGVIESLDILLVSNNFDESWWI
jgi:hypothetical protein